MNLLPSVFCVLFAMPVFSAAQEVGSSPEKAGSIRGMVERIANISRDKPPAFEDLQKALLLRFTLISSNAADRTYRADVASEESLTRVEIHEFFDGPGRIKRLEVVFDLENVAPWNADVLPSKRNEGRCLGTEAFSAESLPGWSLVTDPSPFSARETIFRRVSGGVQNLSTLPKDIPGVFRCVNMISFSVDFNKKVMEE
ncbi:hypothetical protein ACQ859_07925 [Roseateles chitinivorans]|uniref:hypothetical protein n=1 Tax=Roseateles chitinivorans TaxID=2917965 RepID=UPI003D67EDB0